MMTCARLVLSAVLALPLWAAGVADSAELSPTARLVPGGGAVPSDAPAVSLGETRLPLVSAGKLSAGAVSAPSRSPLPFGQPGSPLAVGGYVAYGNGPAQLSSSLRSDGTTSGANVSASWGNDSRAALSLGVNRTDWSRISPNSQHPALTLADPYRSIPNGGGSEVNMSLSLTHQVSPSFSVGGMAGANRTGGSESPGTGLSVGAGLGYRF
ncbi:conserved exported protein of unknown function [Magnetospirillum sp. XM-1]|uniref:hypothetical protein n=1 Tax=Magnetospirillum sp. XM-1 TaxID=1663591 RepID=UPI00073DBA4D|nr:hypothetical protein [Magnetospirillum sp. XM-1]CUW37306.1 conserved exported protein of unknown function [Magnetospirillum sp. XM-1]